VYELKEEGKSAIMNLEIEDDFGVGEPELVRKILEDVLASCLELLDVKYSCDVSVTLTDDERIREINRETRDLDKSTDVLSFPMLSFETPGDLSLAEEDRAGSFHPETGDLLLGDVVISMDHVKAQAEAYNHSEKRELAFLMAHSLLHLFGYDHETDGERIEMEKLQEEILNRKGYTRDVC